MHHTGGSAAPTGQPRTDRPKRYARVSIHESNAAEMLQGCPVVTVDGEVIGWVDTLVIDLRTHQLRYVMLTCGEGPCAEVAIPWKALYFDSALARLVFYTWP